MVRAWRGIAEAEMITTSNLFFAALTLLPTVIFLVTTVLFDPYGINLEKLSGL